MKRILFLLSAVMMLFASCLPQTGPDPTGVPAVPTEEATEAPVLTLTPTEAPAPTETPDFSALIPKTGRLTDGPIFPEPFKYLVLPGDGNLHYVFNSMGEFLYSFAALDNEMDGCSSSGLFTEDGISCWVRLRDRTELKPFIVFGDMVLTLRYIEDEDDWLEGRMELASISDKSLENPREFAEGEINFDRYGGILKIDGGYLVVRRGYDNDFALTGRIIRLDEDFNPVGTIDPERIGGNIAGVLGGRYLIGVVETGELTDWGEPEKQYDLYTLDLQLVMEDINPVRYDFFCIDDEVGWRACGLVMAGIVEGADGRYYDGDLNVVDELPDWKELLEESVNEPYYFDGVWIYGADEEMHGGWQVIYGGESPYEGIKYNGEWVFRIYAPLLAEDTQQGVWGIGDYWNRPGWDDY